MYNNNFFPTSFLDHCEVSTLAAVTAAEANDLKLVANIFIIIVIKVYYSLDLFCLLVLLLSPVIWNYSNILGGII